ncbi:hypothetical protein [Paenibacillus hunanensis]|uniref:Uncharacterized protein n=1 Tax=Paenibacillus hunanensis TaxID=539262 RepID=A0ABU1IW04_9BACL|nr:hypothetical protein [Paenibacillus hunanensis]MDR6243437.1 hypothetical protein [Paenibacillus hunanensis]GGI97715.1 hypothetical protein GCM10008022_03020 [Paenibacillus hunanensis]
MDEICEKSKPVGMSDLTWKKFYKLLAKANIKYREEIINIRAAEGQVNQKTS